MKCETQGKVPDSKVTTKSSGTPTPMPTPGELLVAKCRGMLSPAAVLDVCALYGRSNPALVSGLVRSLGELDDGAIGVTLVEGLGEACSTAARALGEVHAKVGHFFVFFLDGEGGGGGGGGSGTDLFRLRRRQPRMCTACFFCVS